MKYSFFAFSPLLFLPSYLHYPFRLRDEWHSVGEKREIIIGHDYQNHLLLVSLPEYNFDYRKARPNRFVTQERETQITVTLDPDVAEVFKTSEAVNNALRAILSATPPQT